MAWRKHLFLRCLIFFAGGLEVGAVGVDGLVGFIDDDLEAEDLDVEEVDFDLGWAGVLSRFCWLVPWVDCKRMIYLLNCYLLLG